MVLAVVVVVVVVPASVVDVAVIVEATALRFRLEEGKYQPQSLFTKRERKFTREQVSRWLPWTWARVYSILSTLYPYESNLRAAGIGFQSPQTAFRDRAG